MKNAWVLLAAVVLAACGSANTGSDGTGVRPPPTDLAMASGPVTSLGPLGVAGAELNDTGTQVLVNTTPDRPATDLRLGMLADASGLVAPSDGSGVATTAVAQSVVRGPVTDIDAANRTLSVMGVPVRVDQNTLYDEIAGLHEIGGLGGHVEVYGLRLPGQEGTLATRLIYHSATPPAAVEVLGAVTDFSAGAPTIATPGVQVRVANAEIGTASPSGVQILPPGVASLSPGPARVRGTYDAATGTLTATSITTGFAAERPEGRLVYVEGFVISRGSTTAAVGEVLVDTTQLATPLTVGMRVQLRGRMASGSLRADQVSVIPAGTVFEYVVEGPIIAFASVADFYVRGERIDGSQATVTGGAPASLGQGVRVRVRGVAGPGRLTAREVAILN